MFASRISHFIFPARNPLKSIAARCFSTESFMGGLKDEEFLPDREMKEIDHQRKLDSSIKVNKKPDSLLKH